MGSGARSAPGEREGATQRAEVGVVGLQPVRQPRRERTTGHHGMPSRSRPWCDAGGGLVRQVRRGNGLGLLARTSSDHSYRTFRRA
jgi:hypothetical protein